MCVWRVWVCGSEGVESTVQPFPPISCPALACPPPLTCSWAHLCSGVSSGEVVFRQGDVGSSFYIIVHGEVEVSIGGEGAPAPAAAEGGADAPVAPTEKVVLNKLTPGLYFVSVGTFVSCGVPCLCVWVLVLSVWVLWTCGYCVVSVGGHAPEVGKAGWRGRAGVGGGGGGLGWWCVWGGGGG